VIEIETLGITPVGVDINVDQSFIDFVKKRVPREEFKLNNEFTLYFLGHPVVFKVTYIKPEVGVFSDNSHLSIESKHFIATPNLYHITLDEGEEDFYVIANTKYDALGFLLKSEHVGNDESVLDRLTFWGETKAIIGAVLS